MKYRAAVVVVFVLLLAGASGELMTPSSPTPMLARADIEQTLARIDTTTTAEAKTTTKVSTPIVKKNKTVTNAGKITDPAISTMTTTPLTTPSPSADVNTLINNDYANEL